MPNKWHEPACAISSFEKDSFNIYLSKRDENLNLNEHKYSSTLKLERVERERLHK